MRKSKVKIIVPIALILLAISLIICANYYINTKEEVITVSKNFQEPKVVILSENNCEIKEGNKTKLIQKYNGNADQIIIDENSIKSLKVEIDTKAFVECGNLETILIDKNLVSENLEIENFEKDEEYKDKQYVQYKNTKQYSEAYKQYMALSEEEKRETELLPKKYEVSMSALYTQSMEENYKISQLAETEIPTSFDLRDKIDIKVEDQASAGICYAFASLTSVETNLALNYNDNVDLSEVHIACLADDGNGYGGRFIEDTDSYYMDTIGPVYEEEWPIEDLWATNKDTTTKAIYKYLTVNGSSLSSSVQETLKETKAKKLVKETVNFPAIVKRKFIFRCR